MAVGTRRRGVLQIGLGRVVSIEDEGRSGTGRRRAAKQLAWSRVLAAEENKVGRCNGGKAVVGEPARRWKGKKSQRARIPCPNLSAKDPLPSSKFQRVSVTHLSANIFLNTLGAWEPVNGVARIS